MAAFQTNLQCHSLSIDHRTRCVFQNLQGLLQSIGQVKQDVLPVFTIMNNGAHFLLVRGQHVLRLLFKNSE